jgi:hypothetical protein
MMNGMLTERTGTVGMTAVEDGHIPTLNHLPEVAGEEVITVTEREGVRVPENDLMVMTIERSAGR